MNRPRILIICPYTQAANNGNWQTAQRWATMLGERYEVTIAQDWDGHHCDAMLALHARRSAPAIARWAQAKTSNNTSANTHAIGLGVVLTGTDLYRDIHVDASAQASLNAAQILLALQERAPAALPLACSHKARVIFQSTQVSPFQDAANKIDLGRKNFRVVMVGHLRTEKAPETLFAAAHFLRSHAAMSFVHIGAALDPELGAAAQACALANPNYQWLGGLPHQETLAQIQQAHLLVHASHMEGGAHAILEAVCAGTPVLASDIDGNIGMLGDDYAGYFKVGNAGSLVDLLLQCSADFPNDTYRRLEQQCDQRAPLFSPAAEKARLLQLVEELLSVT